MFEKRKNRFKEIDFVNQPWQDDPILFYPKDFYVFDNFSSFQVERKNKLYPTAEHAYQSAKFLDTNIDLAEEIRNTRSAHNARSLANKNRDFIDPKRDLEKIDIMKSILYAKIEQHPYVKKKLLQSWDRIIIEDSRRDSKRWRWEDKNWENLLWKIWMEIREEIKNKD